MGVCRIWVFAEYSISWLDFVGMPMDRLKFVELQDMHVTYVSQLVPLQLVVLYSDCKTLHPVQHWAVMSARASVST